MSGLNLGLVVRLLMVVFAGLSWTAGRTQRMNYSHEQIKAKLTDSVQLVPQIGGHFHMVAFRTNGAVDIGIYTPDLRLEKLVRADMRVPERSAAQIIPRGRFYFVYVNPFPPQLSSLWRVNEDGSTENLTEKLRSLITLRFRDPVAQPLLIGTPEGLVMNYPFRLVDSSHMMFRLLKLNDSLDVSDSMLIRLGTDMDLQRIEQLRQRAPEKVMLLTRSRRGARELELTEGDYSDYTPARLRFESPNFFFYMPELSSPAADGHFMVSARMIPLDRSGPQHLFISEVNDSLGEVRHNANMVSKGACHYVFIDQKPVDPLMIPAVPFMVSDFSRDIVLGNREQSFRQDMRVIRVPNSTLTGRYSFSRAPRVLPLAFSILDSNFNLVYDTVLINDDQYPIIPQDYLSFHYNGKGFVLLEESLPRNSMSFMIVYNQRDRLMMDNIPVYNKYDFFLSQGWLSPQGDLYIPYRNKTEVGLMRLRIDY